MDFYNLFKNILNGSSDKDNSREARTVTQKDPLKIRITNTSEIDKIEIYYYIRYYKELTPIVTIDNRELTATYKGQEKKAKFSKDPSKYLLDRNSNFGVITYVLYKEKKIVSLSQILDTVQKRRNWEEQVLEKEIRDMRIDEADFLD